MSDSGWRRLRRIWRPTVRDAVDDELAFHVQMRVDQFMASGLPREEAERAARDRFGDVNRVSSTLVDIDHRRERRLDLRERFDAVRLDILVSLRALRREPLFAAGVILTLALGIGANATMFGIVDRLMLRGPAHVADASNVYRLYISINTAARGIVSTDVFGYVTYAELRDHAKSFAGVGAYTNAESGRYGTGARARPLPIAYGTWDLFPTLGVRPIVGRFFDRGEDAAPKAASVVVISEEFWRSEFGGERDVLGRRIAINGEQYTVIGVAPADFAGPERSRVDAWLPMAVQTPRPDWPTTYQAEWLRVAVRLAPGVSAERAGVEATTLLRGAYTGPSERYRKLVATPKPLWYDDDGVPSGVANISRWLLGVSLVVLLVTCANVANLLIARARRRRRESAVRIALGAGRARLVRLVFTETMLVVLAGAVAALGVAALGTHAMRATLLASVAWDGNAVDLRVFAATLALAVVVGVMIGIAPALDAVNPSITSALKTGAGEGGGRRARLRATLSALQAAMCVVLLIGAGLFVESLVRSRSVDLGFQPGRVLRAYPDFSLEGLKGDVRAQAKARNAAILRATVEHVRRLPWVETAALSIGSPFGFGFGVTVRMPGRDSIPTVNGAQPHITAVDAGYFATVGTPLRAGRVFTAADREGSTPVVVVNETMARALWPGENPLGKCLEIGDPAPGVVILCSSVVGVVADVHLSSLREKPSMQYYVPLGQERGIGGSSLLVRPRGDAHASMPLLHDALIAMPAMPYTTVAVLQESLDPQYRPWTLGATMFGVFGVLALVIAAVGLYSVIAYLVADRTRELGVRIALGATGGRIVREVVMSGVRVAVLGIAVGVAIALGAARFVEPLLFDMNARDPLVFSTVSATVLAIAVFAAWWPARRASRVDPVIALRAE